MDVLYYNNDRIPTFICEKCKHKFIDADYSVFKFGGLEFLIQKIECPHCGQKYKIVDENNISKIK